MREHGASAAGVSKALIVADGERGVVVLRHRELVAGAFQTRLWVPDIQAGRERLLVTGPLTEPGPLIAGFLTGLLSAATTVLVDGPADVTAATIERERPTLMLTDTESVAAIAHDSASARRDLGSLRVILVNGPSLEPREVLELERLTSGARLRYGFAPPGAGAFALAQPVYGRVVAGSLGVPVTNTVAAIMQPDDLSTACEPGVVGRLVVTGPQVGVGGPCGDDATDECFVVDGWVVTDQLALMDDEGVFSQRDVRSTHSWRTVGGGQIRRNPPTPPP